MDSKMAKRKESSRQSVFELDVVKKFEKSNASVEELRTGIWAPIEKLSHNSLILKNFEANKRRRTIETSWGKVVVSGNILMQSHRDLLDCVLAVSTKTKELDGGDIAVYFTKADALRKYGDQTAKNQRWLDDKLNEIQNTSIELRDNLGNYYRFSILKLTAYSEKEETFGIVFTKEYRTYIEGQLTIGYLAELDKLLDVKSALLKSIIRFFWTHKDFWKMDIDKLLVTVGYPTDSDQMIRSAKREIENNIDILERFGIKSAEERVIENNRTKIKKLLYHKPDDMKITFLTGINTIPTLK